MIDPHETDPKLIAGHVEGWFMVLEQSDRVPLLARLARLNDEFPEPAPRMTPEQVAMIDRRAEEVDRGEVELSSIEETTRGLSEVIRRVGAGEDPDTVLAELRARRDSRRGRPRVAASVEEREPAGVA